MYRKIILVSVVFVLLLVLSGCKKNIELVEPSQISNQIMETMRNKTEPGVYAIESSKNQVIIYYGVKKGIKAMSSSLENNVLTIFFETEKLNQPQYYAYKVNSSSLFDTIQISIDGKNEAFNTVFVQ